MNMTRRFSAAICLSAAALLSLPGATFAQTYPSRTITVIVPFAAGGFSDSFARLIATRLGEKLGQSVVVENKPGAGGNIGSAMVAKAAPDGHTLLATTNSLAVNETLSKDRGFAIDELKAVSLSGWAPEVVIVNAQHPAKTFAEFLAGTKDKAVSFGSPGRGTVAHIVITYMFKQLGREATHVPFQGGAPLVNALMGGHIDMAGGATVGFSSQIQSGAIRTIAVANDGRLPEYKDIPTYVESGFPGVVIKNWVGFFVPDKTPDAIADKLNATINEIVQEPEIQARFRTFMMRPEQGDRRSAQAEFKDDLTRWAKMVKEAGLAEK